MQDPFKALPERLLWRLTLATENGVLRVRVQKISELVKVRKPQIVAQQMSEGVKYCVEQGMVPTKCGNRFPLEPAHDRTGPSVWKLNRNKFEIGVPEAKMEFDSPRYFTIVQVAFPDPARFLDQCGKMIDSQLSAR
jgi:hypothetical protein